VPSWQYAWLTDQPYTTIGFSHPQPGLAGELAGVLGVGVYAQQSTEWSISLDRSRVNLGYVSGLLGDRGWEMFSVETRLQPNAMTPAQLQTNWYFKRQGPDRAAGATMSATQSMAPAAQSAPSMSAAPMPTFDTSVSSSAAAPAMPDAAPPMMQSSMPDAAPPMASAPEMAPQMAPQMAPEAPPAMPAAPMAPPAMPAAPMAPPGPEAASMSGVTTPPPGPGGYTPTGG
jgi:hypothetical protein